MPKIELAISILLIVGLITIVTISRLFNIDERVIEAIWGWYALLSIIITIHVFNKLKEEKYNDKNKL